jgi:hypothetical protein
LLRGGPGFAVKLWPVRKGQGLLARRVSAVSGHRADF